MKYAVVGTLSVFLFVGACSSSDEATPGKGANGVNDVAKACQVRQGWTKSSSSTCTECRSLAVAAFCECRKDDGFTGFCHDQRLAMLAEPQCEGVDKCVSACNEDCACIDACHQGKDACRKVAAAVDGCVADVCDRHCR